MTTANNNNLIFGILLIGGAVLYSRRSTAATIPAGTVPLGTGSMPGSVGTGVSQALGGLLGNLFSPKTGGGTSTGAPVSNTGLGGFPEMAGDGVIQNSIPDADPMGSFDPTLGGNSWGSSIMDNLA
jgi:hypothetical protein